MLKTCEVCLSQFEAPPTGNKTCGKKCASELIRRANTTHGDSYDRLYTIWRGLRSRAGKLDHYQHVTVCEEWGTYAAFKRWAIGAGYAPTLEIDRKDNSGGYCPENCRWATRTQQMENTSVRKVKNKTSRFKGVQRMSHMKQRQWRAVITRNGKPVHLGCFDTEMQAAIRYDEEARRQFGEFACLNFPQGGVTS